MDPISLLLPIGTAVGIVLALLNIREKLWPKAPTPPAASSEPHPLAASLDGIATAIRERRHTHEC